MRRYAIGKVNLGRVMLFTKVQFIGGRISYIWVDPSIEDGVNFATFSSAKAAHDTIISMQDHGEGDLRVLNVEMFWNGKGDEP